MKSDDFHKHLDTCAQCEKNPFNLCPIGYNLLVKAASSLDVIRVLNADPLDTKPFYAAKN